MIEQKIYSEPEPKKMKIDWWRIFGAFLIVGTLVVVTYALFPWAKFAVDKYILRRPEASVAETPDANGARQQKQDVYLRIETGDVKIIAPIVEGVDVQDLKKGVGHHPGTPWPDDLRGNVILAGHSSDIDPRNPYGKIFRNLSSVKINDLVSINYPKKEYVYKVIGKYEISPSDTSLFGQDAGPRLTFYTCSPVFTDWRRLVYVAQLQAIKTDKK